MVVHNTLTFNCSDQLVDVFLLGKRRFDDLTASLKHVG